MPGDFDFDEAAPPRHPPPRLPPGSNWCAYCQAPTLAVERGAPNHLAHLLASIFLLGLWLFVWMLRAARPVALHCSRCGGKVGERPGAVSMTFAAAVVGILIGVACLVAALAIRSRT